jgi:hypothetical protein
MQKYQCSFFFGFILSLKTFNFRDKILYFFMTNSFFFFSLMIPTVALRSPELIQKVLKVSAVSMEAVSFPNLFP